MSSPNCHFHRSFWIQSNQSQTMYFFKIRGLAALASILALSKTLCSANNTQQFPFIQTIFYNANNPIEDRLAYARLKSIDGFTASVFDGHGGDLTSQYASKHLNEFLDARIAQNRKLNLTNEKLIEKSLAQAYDDVEQGFFAIFKQNLNNKVYRTVGSCALTAVILKNSLHIANAGDCQGVILSEKQAAMTNLRLNAGQKFQQVRLFKKFPDEPDIVRCRTACYVKGRLQPTRSFGDFYLKFKEYNFTNLSVFSGPYIEAAPLLTHFTLTDLHQNLILGTDGLWDQLNDVQIHEVFRSGERNLAKAIFDRAMEVILKREKLVSIHDLNKIPYRRDLHDDITIVNIRLQELRALLK